MRATSDELAACVIVGMMSTYEALLSDCVAPHTWMLFPAGWSEAGDWPDLAASPAPSPLLVQFLLDDELFTADGMRNADLRLAAAYARANAPEAYRGEFYPGPHRFDIPMQEAALAWLQLPGRPARPRRPVGLRHSSCCALNPNAAMLLAIWRICLALCRRPLPAHAKRVEDAAAPTPSASPSSDAAAGRGCGRGDRRSPRPGDSAPFGVSSGWAPSGGATSMASGKPQHVEELVVKERSRDCCRAHWLGRFVPLAPFA
jgi:hypothetical protein